jgi:hypothetical protein
LAATPERDEREQFLMGQFPGPNVVELGERSVDALSIPEFPRLLVDVVDAADLIPF